MRFSNFLQLSTLLPSLLILSCGGTDELLEGQWGKADTDSLDTLSLITYNTGLAHGNVALAEERLPEIAQKLSEVDADVLCLQEVWSDEDAAYIEHALQERYPHVFREVTYDTSEKTAPCGITATLGLSNCVDEKCTKVGISAEECVMDRNLCQEQYDGLSQECQLCLAANTAAPKGCALGLWGFGGAQEFANEGRNGLMLFSRYPLGNPRYTPFDTLLVKRGVISAEIIGLGMDVHCTHLTSNLRSVPYPKDKPYSSWVDEQVGQVQLIEDQSSVDHCTVVMGDLNAGLAEKALSAELPENFEQFTALGFSEQWSDRRCTWCKDNPLAGSTVNMQLDHLLVRNCPQGTYDYRRVMDEVLTVETSDSRLTTRYSDHYGLRLDITPVRDH